MSSIILMNQSLEKADQFKCIKVNDFNHLKSLIKEFRKKFRYKADPETKKNTPDRCHHYFRGQRCAAWKLETTYERSQETENLSIGSLFRHLR